MDMQRLVDSFLKIFSLAMPCLCSQLCTSPAVSAYSLVKTSSNYSVKPHYTSVHVTVMLCYD